MMILCTATFTVDTAAKPIQAVGMQRTCNTLLAATLNSWFSKYCSDTMLAPDYNLAARSNAS